MSAAICAPVCHFVLWWRVSLTLQRGAERFEELHTGAIRIGQQGVAQCSYAPSVAILDDTLYVAYVAANSDPKKTSTNTLPHKDQGAPPHRPSKILQFSAPMPAIAPDENAAVGPKAPVVLNTGTSLCTYRKLLYLTDGHAFGVERQFEEENRTRNPLQTVAHQGGMYTFYLDQDD